MDENFLKTLKESFLEYLNSGERSNKKLCILHSKIAKDLSKKLGNTYIINSLGFGNFKEDLIFGRYYDKKVDITISKDDKILAGIGVKFVMSNYSQNSNNYFENMLGETANIRSNSIAYFQIFILFDELAYFGIENNKKIIKKIEKITQHNIQKYINLSNDNVDIFMHTPNKTLVYLIKNSVKFRRNLTQNEYKNLFFDKKFTIQKSNLDFSFGNNIIYNKYNEFIDKISHFIQSI